MAYYSNVAITMQEESFKELKELAAKNGFAEFVRMFNLHYVDGCEFIQLSMDCVKWYDQNEEVAFVEKFLENMYIDNIPYCFIRIGESPDDVVIDDYTYDMCPDEFIPHIEKHICYCDKKCSSDL
jgi:hypothetical protein